MVDDVFDEVGLKAENLHASYGAVEAVSYTHLRAHET